MSAKDATTLTAERNAAFASGLPLADRADFERCRQGLVATSEARTIPRGAGGIIWDFDRYAFMDGDAPPTVNPSLWRQGQLNMANGLFKVTDGIYQVRGFDIANITFIEGQTGWIVIDPLTSTETARAALELANLTLGERPVRAVIYTHSHVDHWGGVRGVIDPADVERGDVAVVAPEGFLAEAVSENVYAGPAMTRRAQYMYGHPLPTGPRGQVDVGLGKSVALGQVGLIAPTDLIRDTGETRDLDGVRIEFQNTPNAEAPAEMMFYFPEHKALCAAENCTAVMHNLYTPRGAQVRDSLAWSKYIGETIELFGDRLELVFACHHWPHFGRDDALDHLRKQRDLYRFLHDQTLRLANRGLTPREIAEDIELPKSLNETFHTRGYYGTLSHNTKAVYQRYLGWFDANPANLEPHPPVDAAKRYVEFMGGADAILEKARLSFAEGDYRWVGEVVNHVVFAEPDNTSARELQADALEQLGYMSEAAPWRNFYLVGAQELREGVKGGAGQNPNWDLLNALDTEMIFDSLAVRLDGIKADGQNLKINWVFPDRDERFVLSLENSALSHVQGRLDAKAETTVTLDRTTLSRMLGDPTKMAEAVASGEILIDGDGSKLTVLFEMLERATPQFPIVTP